MAATSSYHHGDLQSALLDVADDMLRSDGIDGLSLRKMALAAGVSRTAPYHHFRDKHALLCSLAERGFKALAELLEACRQQGQDDPKQAVTSLVERYLAFATDHPHRYELMFGRTIWQQGQATESLKTVAYDSFQLYLSLIDEWFGTRLDEQTPVLRVAQATWASLHGLCRLYIDGVYADGGDSSGVCEVMVKIILGECLGDHT